MTHKATLCWTAPIASLPGPKQYSTGHAKCARRIAAATVAVLVMNSAPLAVDAAEVAIFDHDKTLSNRDFSGKDLRGAIFTKSVAQKANFRGAQLDGAQLDDANVSTSNWSK